MDTRRIWMAVVLGASYLVSCSSAGTHQRNLVVDARRTGALTLASTLSEDLGSELTRGELNLPNSDHAPMFRLDGKSFIVIISPLPDDRCNADAGSISTFNGQQFRIDIVDAGRGQKRMEAIEQETISTLQRLNLPFTEYKDCQ